MKDSVKKRSKFRTFFGLGARASLLLVVIGAITLVGVIGSAGLFRSGANVGASANPAPTPRNQKRYIATQRIAIDERTGKSRMPTEQEVQELVDNLKNLTRRPTEGLETSKLLNGATSIDLDGGFNGVMLARPNADGTFETRCVFTFDEGAEFLGLVEDKS